MNAARLVTIFALAWPPLAGAAEPPAGRDLHRQAVPACAWVFAGDQGRGTGWVADVSRRWLVTSFHIVGDARTVDVIFPSWQDGDLLADRDDVLAKFLRLKRTGRVLKRDSGRDLALVEMDSLPETARALPLADGPARPGETAYGVGNRRDLDQLWSHTSAMVRQAFRSADGYPWHTQRLATGCRLLALQAPINEGDSGGPVLNRRGELIGVVAAILWQAERSAAAIDVAEVRAFLGPDFVRKQPGSAPAGRELYRRLVRSAAWVQSPFAVGRSSGFLIDRERRLLLTTARAVGSHERIDIIYPRFERDRVIAEADAYKDAPRVRAAVVARDPRRNLAVLEAESVPAEALGLEPAGESARPGDALHAVSNPNGIDALWLYTAAAVRQVGKAQLSPSKEDGVATALVLQAPGSANDGGGPVVDSAGKLVAVAGGKDGPEQQVSYAVDVSEVKAFLAETRPQWQPRTAGEFHARGARRTRLRQFDAALADFREALRLDPGHIPTLIDLPELHHLRREPDQALAIIDLALKTLPPNRRAIPLARRAELAIDRGQYDAALQDCDAAIKIDAKCAVAFAVRAEAWRRKMDRAKALADADEAIWLDPNLGPAYLVRGRTQLDRREWERALDDLTRAVELAPFDPAPLRERAKAFEGKTPPETDKAKRDREAAGRLK